MRRDHDLPAWLFVADTERYAGNFERRMTLYCTGVLGELHVHPELDDDDLIDFEDGTISEQIINELDEKLDIYANNEQGHALSYPTPGWSNDGMGKETKLEPSEEMKHPAYLSVAIIFTARPSDELLELLKNRASQYCQLNKIELTKCRLVHQEVTVEEEVI